MHYRVSGIVAAFALLCAGLGGGEAAWGAARKAARPVVKTAPAPRTAAPPKVNIPPPQPRPGTAALEAAYKAFDDHRLDEAFPILVLACDADAAKACYDVGMVHASPKLGMYDAVKALDLYRKGCKLGHGPACFSAGTYSWDFARTDAAKAESSEDLKRGCDAGDSNSCNTYGFRLERGLGVAKDEKGGLPFYLKACDLKHEVACVNGAIDLENGLGTDKDYAKARSLYDKACEMKSKDGCFWSAVMLKNGKGVAADLTKAREVFVDLCKQEYARSCSQMGYMLQYGEGGPKDQKAAREQYGAACKGNYVQGCTNLGWMLYRGQGGPVDYAQAVDLFSFACDKGQSYACTGMADAYTNAHGVMVDASAAAMYRNRAVQLMRGE